jgi:stress response protein SCP2
LPPGANVALPNAALGIALDGPFDLSALVLSASGTVAGDADMVFFNQPDAPGVRLRGSRLTVLPDALRRGAERVVVVASPENLNTAVRTLPPVVLTDARERPFARFRPPPMPTQTVALLVEVYRRAGAWRVRAVGQGYADGLAGLARDFGVDVADDVPPAPTGTGPERRDGSGGPAPTGTGRGRGGGPGRGEGRRNPGRSWDDDGLRSGGGSADAVLGEVVNLTNAERASHGLRPLTVDGRLAAAAQAHSADMVRRGFFAHESPDGRQVWDRAVAAGYAYRKVAENIAAGQRTADEVVRGWMGSPGHRANILDGDLIQIGVGRAEGGSYGAYWTQVFGAPR